MSYTEILLFHGGIPDKSVEYRNSWGGAARIWDALFNQYIPKLHEYDSWVCGDAQRLWDLAKRDDLPMFERAVLAFTFDGAYVRRDHFGEFADCLKQFIAKYPSGDRVDHLPAWSHLLDGADAEAIGFYATSCGENWWMNYGRDTGEATPKPIKEGFEIYDWLHNISQLLIHSSPD